MAPRAIRAANRLAHEAKVAKERFDTAIAGAADEMEHLDLSLYAVDARHPSFTYASRMENAKEKRAILDAFYEDHGIGDLKAPFSGISEHHFDAYSTYDTFTKNKAASSRMAARKTAMGYSRQIWEDVFNDKSEEVMALYQKLDAVPVEDGLEGHKKAGVVKAGIVKEFLEQNIPEDRADPIYGVLGYCERTSVIIDLIPSNHRTDIAAGMGGPSYIESLRHAGVPVSDKEAEEIKALGKQIMGAIADNRPLPSCSQEQRGASVDGLSME